jgi:lysophospholipase L1-like esterase
MRERYSEDAMRVASAAVTVRRVVWFLTASLVVNVLLLVVVGRRLRQQGLREVLIRAGARRSMDADFAAFAHRTFAPLEADCVVFVGDSQVARAPLLEMLTPYRNRGIARATISNVFVWIDGVLADQPAHIVLMMGGNDVYFGVPSAESSAAFGRLLDRIAERSGCRVTMLSVPPLPGREPAVNELNAALAKLAAERGHAWVDLVPTLSAMHWTDDGIHLNAAAYRAVAPAIAGAVSAASK